MAKFVLPMPELSTPPVPKDGKPPVGPDRLKAVLEAAMSRAEAELQRKYASLEGADLQLEEVRGLDLGLSSDPAQDERVAAVWGRAIVAAVEGALPHVQLAKGLSAEVRAALGAWVPGGSGAAPSGQVVFMLGWELGDSDQGKRVAAFLQGTRNETAPVFGAAASRRPADVGNLHDFLGTGITSGEAALLAVHGQLIGDQFVHNASDVALSRGYKLLGEKVDALSLYARARLAGNHDVPRYLADLWGPSIGGKVSAAWFEEPARNYPATALGGLPRAQLPQLAWRPILPRDRVLAIARECVELCAKGQHAEARRRIAPLGELDRLRVSIAWREAAPDAGWTEYEIAACATRHANPSALGWIGAHPAPIWDDLNDPAPSGAIPAGARVLVHAEWTDAAGGKWLGVEAKDQRGWISATTLWRAEYHKVDGVLFARGPKDRDEVSPNDVVQGSLGTCYLLSTLAAIAFAHPDHIRQSIRDHGDSASVRFYERDKVTGAHTREVWVRVSLDFQANKRGGFLLTHSRQRDADGKFELWPAVFEKAYAAWKGGYDAIDYGNPGLAMRELLGPKATSSGVEIAGNAAVLHPLFAHARDTVNWKKDGVHAMAPGLSDADRQLLETYWDDAACKQLRADLERKPSLAFDVPLLVHHAKAAGVSKAGQKILADWLEAERPKALGSKRYPPNAVRLFDTLKAKLDAVRDGSGRHVVVLGTRKWTGEQTAAAGEAVSKEAAGLVATHAYTVLDAYTGKDGRKYVRVLNPHGRRGRKYKNKSALANLLGFKLKGVEQDDPEFEIELSDVVRYFQTVNFTQVA